VNEKCERKAKAIFGFYTLATDKMGSAGGKPTPQEARELEDNFEENCKRAAEAIRESQFCALLNRLKSTQHYPPSFVGNWCGLFS